MLERAKLACNTAKAIFPEDTAPVSEEDKVIARDAFAAMSGLSEKKAPSLPQLSHYPNASLRHLDALLTEYDVELVNSAVRIREYVKNKLLVESENPDGKIRIRALELLGKIKDVGLFTDRLEITNKTKSDEELEAELQSKLDQYLNNLKIIPAEVNSSEDEENAADTPVFMDAGPVEAEKTVEIESLLDRLTPAD